MRAEAGDMDAASTPLLTPLESAALEERPPAPADAAPSQAALEKEASARLPFRALVELSKPAITRLVLVTTALGAVAAPGTPPFVDVLPALIGTALVVAGANALNMFLERDSDRFMTRTSTRPLPTGRLSEEVALGFGVLVSILGLWVLAQFTSHAAVLLAALALLSYVLVYTPMKRLSWLALVVGAVPGAMPPAIGYAALTGTVDGVGFWLFAILFIWQLPHFLAISIFRRDEYRRAGLAVLPNSAGVRATQWIAFGLAIALAAVTVMPWFMGRAPLSYLLIAAASGLLFSAVALLGLVRGTADDDSVSGGRRWTSERWARVMFFSSMPHLVLVMTALVVTTA